MFLGLGKAFNPNYVSKKDKLIISLVFGFPFLIFFVFITYQIVVFGRPRPNDLKKQDMEQVFHGKVQQYYREENNHGLQVAVSANGERYGVFRGWEREIEIGDSLSKNLNSLVLEVHKPNCKTVYLNYETTYKRDE